MKLMRHLPKIVVDTREKLPYSFRASESCSGVVNSKLDYGDYAIEGHLDLIAIERKQSIDELCGNLGKYRKRFEAELQRMCDANVKFKYIIVEDYYSSIWKNKFSRMRGNTIFASIIALELKYGVHFIFCGNREMGHKIARQLLVKSYKYFVEE